MISDLDKKHLACVLLVDVSGSMLKDNAIGKLNEALQDFKKALLEDELCRTTVDVSIVSFSAEVKIEVPFTPVGQLEIPELKAFGPTAMNEAILTGLDLLEKQKAEYKSRGIACFRPWLFLMTDGCATDGHYETAVKTRIREAVACRRLTFFSFGIGPSADMAALKEYNNGSNVIRLESADCLKELFTWILQSMSVVVNSAEDATRAELPPLPGGTILVD